MDIARVIGANEKHNGYMQGSGYIVTWALGHLVQLALPSYYGQPRPSAENLPIIPDPFRLTIRHRKTEKGTSADPAAVKQMNVIDGVLSKCTSVIAATDAGREGELIFRYIYSHTSCNLPVRRLWISSLTDEAIRDGFESLRDGTDYDSLFKAADCRAKADWLVGINASQALAVASGTGNSSLGRVQTPTLALICSRFLENRGFLPSEYWALHITLEREGKHRQFAYTGEIREQAECDRLAPLVAPGTDVHIVKAENKTAYQAPPLLYDLTALQKDCNIHHDLPADKTLEVAQALYEKKLITYPRTGSRYIPDDVFRTAPALLDFGLGLPRFASLRKISSDWSKPTRRCVDASKVTDHHALLVTGNPPGELSGLEAKVYEMITGRMLESFGPRCVKEITGYTAIIGEMEFTSRTVRVTDAGWRSVFSRSEDREEDESEQPESTAEFTEGYVVPLSGHSFAKRKTRPKPLYTEATLLTAMETAGRDITDDATREAMKECGIGTPATRAAIIVTLFRREYIERSGKSLIPTEKGLYMYKAVKDMRIADVQLTGDWEKALTDIEAGRIAPESFLKAIKVYTKQVTAEVLSLNFPQTSSGTIPCPKCGNGRIIIRHKLAKCDSEKCGLLVFRRFLNKELTDQHLEQLFSSGKTKLIKGFKGKRSDSFDAKLAFDKNFNLTFSFPPKKSNGNGKRPPKATAKRVKK